MSLKTDIDQLVADAATVHDWAHGNASHTTTMGGVPVRSPAKLIEDNQIVVNEAAALASTATTQAGIATTQAGIATTQAGIATTQAGIATTQAGIATTQAGIATTKAGESAASAAAALASQNSSAANAGTATTKAGEASSSAAAAAASAAVINLTAPGPIGGTTPAAGTFTDLATTGNTILGNASTDTLNVGDGGLVKAASGNVGVGTASPESILNVVGSDPTLTIGSAPLGVARSTLRMGVYLPGSLTFIDSNSGSGGTNLPLSLNIAGTEKMRVSTTGNVLIGTTTDDGVNKLQVNGSLKILGANSLKGSYGGGGITINFAVGDQSLVSNTTGSPNTALGYAALSYNTTGNENTAVGSYALQFNISGGDNTSIGHYALRNNTFASYNTAVGVQALLSTTTGGYNTAVGVSTLYSNTTGIDNTAVGTQSLAYNTTGSNNTGVGFQAGYNAGVALATLTNCTFLGYSANASVDGLTNSAAIGNGAQVTASNQIVLGNAAVTAVIANGTLNTTGYTVATLPTAGTAGRRAYVTDATAPTFLGTLTGGGAVKCPVFDNGTAWVAG